MTIIEAILEQDLNQVQNILLTDPTAIETKDEKGVFAPFLAAQIGNLLIVKYIVEYSRASMNMVDKDNKNILHYAVISGNLDLVDYLIERVGLSPLTGDKYGNTPLDIAISCGNKKLEIYFKENQGIDLDKMYRNPIITGTHPDPSIVRVGEDYYMVNSSFVFFPCIPISHSKDLVNWRIIGHAVTDPSYLDLDSLDNGRGIWAPDISYYEGRFYIVATYRLNDGGTVYRKQMVVSSDRAEGPYSKPVFLDEDGIDPSVFTDDDGRRYMLLNRGARIFEVSKDCTKQLSKAELLWYGDNKRAPEGPHLLKKDGYYYLFLAEGGTGPGHRISVGRSKQLMGPFESCPYNPIMIQRDPLASIQRAGHGKPVQTQNGEWYMVYLCGRRLDEKYSILGRETSMDPIRWTPDGWPIINEGRGPSVLQYKPNLPQTSFEQTQNDDFDQQNLGFDWMFARIPRKDSYILQNSQLRLYGDSYDLSHIQARNIIVRRQKDFCFEVSTKLTMPKLCVGQEAGITGYYDTDTYFKYGICLTEKGYTLRVVEKIGDEERKHFEMLLEDKESIYLKINTKYLERSFAYAYEEEKWMQLGSLSDVYYLCDEGITKGKRFTGAMVGMYVISGEDKQKAYADFDYFNYKALEEKRI